VGTEKIHKGDVGTVIEILINQAGTTTAEDVSDATTRKVYVQLKDDQVIAHDADFVTNGSDGLIKFVSTAETFAVAGDAKLQAYLETDAGNKHRTTEYEFVVHDVIVAP